VAATPAPPSEPVPPVNPPDVLAGDTPAAAATPAHLNSPPSFLAGSSQRLPENSPPQTVPGWATEISPGSHADEAKQRVTFLVKVDTAGLFTEAGRPLVRPDGTLVFAPAFEANGTARVTVRAVDDGGTEDGGSDTGPPITFTISVSPVNDPPSFEPGAGMTVLEDAGTQESDWATSISPGPPDETSQTVKLVTSTDSPGLFASPPEIDSGGRLRYAFAPDANGTARVTAHAQDDGGTHVGGDDESDAVTFTLAAIAVNDPPSFVAGGDRSVLEGAAAQTVSGWASRVRAGPPDEAGQALTFAVSTSAPALFDLGGQPRVAADGTLRFRPAAGANGTATVTVRAVDDGGTADGGNDASPPQSFVISVTAINDPPSFNAGANQTALEDAGLQTVAGWATGITAGPPEQSAQVVAFTVTNDNPSLFSVAPAIAPDGTLRYTPAANANGSATVTVRAVDDGGTANGGNDTSPPQSFTISLTPVNDAPVATDISAAIDEDSAGITFSVLSSASDIDADALSAAVDASSLTLGELTENGGGSVTYVPFANAFGTDAFAVTISDGKGGTTLVNVTISVAALPDAPTVADNAYVTTLNTALVITAPGVLANDGDEDGDVLTVDATPVTMPAAGALVLSTDGGFTYTPPLGFVGTVSFVYRALDGTGRSADATATITVSAVVTTGIYYLSSSGASADVWDLSQTAPTDPGVLDYDGDGDPGLTIDKSDGKETNSDPDEQQTWVYPVAAALVLNGPLTLDLWSSVEKFELNKDGHVYVYVYDCVGGSCTTIASTASHVPDWNGTTASWMFRAITIGSVNRVILAGHELRVRLLFNHTPLWVAMAAPYPSALRTTG
jgi:hypothetical protein